MVGFVRADGGGYAEKAAVDGREWLFDLPETASFEEGAAFLLAYLTAWIPLTRQVTLRPGARVLVTAAAGGVGSAGGAGRARVSAREVVGAVGSEDEARRRASGSAPRRPSRTTAIGELEPFDVILDQVGGRAVRRHSIGSSAARDGRRDRVRGRCCGSRSTPRASSAGTSASRASTSAG